MNYRSVQPIVALGNAVIQYITRYFPNSIDRLKPDYGLAQGSLPVFFQTMSVEAFLSRVIGSESRVEFGNIELGADQAIIVRNSDVKKAVQALLGPIAIVLDIRECKGLEFEVSTCLARSHQSEPHRKSH